MGRKRKEFSNDVKKVVWSLLEGGDSIRKVSEILGIPPATISSVRKRERYSRKHHTKLQASKSVRSPLLQIRKLSKDEQKGELNRNTKQI